MTRLRDLLGCHLLAHNRPPLLERRAINACRLRFLAQFAHLDVAQLLPLRGRPARRDRLDDRVDHLLVHRRLRFRALRWCVLRIAPLDSVWNTIDQDGSGDMDASELQTVLTTMG
eukprot:COSAG06_NODE_21644_length_749_cov_0.826421_1_plen_114_part_10